MGLTHVMGHRYPNPPRYPTLDDGPCGHGALGRATIPAKPKEDGLPNVSQSITAATGAALALATALAFAQSGYESPYGEWRGQAQYQAIVRTVSDPAAHAVIDLVIDIDPRGKVTGISSENGCHMLGIAKPGIAPYILTLNVTLRSCAYARFNRIYNGHIIVSAAKKYATFSLQALDVTPGSGGGTFNIEATMRR